MTGKIHPSDIEAVVDLIINTPRGIGFDDLMKQLEKKPGRKYTYPQRKQLALLAHKDSRVGSYFYGEEGQQVILSSVGYIDEIPKGDRYTLTFSKGRKPVQAWSDLNEMEAQESVFTAVQQNAGITHAQLTEVLLSLEWTDNRQSAHLGAARALKKLQEDRLIYAKTQGGHKTYYAGTAPDEAKSATKTKKAKPSVAASQTTGHRVNLYITIGDVHDIVIVYQDGDEVILTISSERTLSPLPLETPIKGEYHGVSSITVRDSTEAVMHEMSWTDVYIY